MLDKVSVVCPNIGLVYSGMGPDFRVLVNKARKSAQAYWKIYGEYPPTRVLTQEIASVMQQATQSGFVPYAIYATLPDILSQRSTTVRGIVISGGLGCKSGTKFVPS